MRSLEICGIDQSTKHKILSKKENGHNKLLVTWALGHKPNISIKVFTFIHCLNCYPSNLTQNSSVNSLLLLVLRNKSAINLLFKVLTLNN